MRGKQRFRANLIREIFDHGPGDGKPVVCACAAPNLVENEQTVFRGVKQYGSHFRHLHHKRTLIVHEIIACTHASEYAIDYGNLRRFCGNETADMRHDRNQRNLPHIRAFARHIRARDDKTSVSFAVHRRIVRNKAFFRERFHHGMSAFRNDKRRVFVHNFRAGVFTLFRYGGKRRKAVECSHVFRHFLQIYEPSGKNGHDVFENPIFQRKRAFFAR